MRAFALDATVARKFESAALQRHRPLQDQLHCTNSVMIFVTHDSALHVGMAPKKMAAPINVLAVIRR